MDDFHEIGKTTFTADQIEHLKRIAPHHKQIEQLSPETEILIVFAQRKRMVNHFWRIVSEYSLKIGRWIFIITSSIAIYSQLGEEGMWREIIQFLTTIGEAARP